MESRVYFEWFLLSLAGGAGIGALVAVTMAMVSIILWRLDARRARQRAEQAMRLLARTPAKHRLSSR